MQSLYYVIFICRLTDSVFSCSSELSMCVALKRAFLTKTSELEVICQNQFKPVFFKINFKLNIRDVTFMKDKGEECSISGGSGEAGFPHLTKHMVRPWQTTWSWRTMWPWCHNVWHDQNWMALFNGSVEWLYEVNRWSISGSLQTFIPSLLNIVWLFSAHSLSFDT